MCSLVLKQRSWLLYVSLRNTFKRKRPRNCNIPFILGAFTLPTANRKLICNKSIQQTTQHIDIAYPKNMNICTLDLSACKKAYFYQDIHAYFIIGLNKIGNIEKIDIYSSSMELTGDCTIDGDFICRGSLSLMGHRMNVKGDLSAQSYLYFDDYNVTDDVRQGGIHEVDGNFKSNSNIYVDTGTIKVHENMTVQRYGMLEMKDRNATVVVDGNFKTNSEYLYNTTLTAGTLKVRGNLVKGEHAASKSLAHTDNFLIKLDGDKLQKISISAGYLDMVFRNLDISESKGVVFQNDVCISRLDGWDKIKGDELVLRNSSITLTKDTKLNTSLVLINSYVNLASKTFEIDGDLEQLDSQMNISEGHLKISGNYMMNGNSRLYMLYEKDILEVEGGFETGSLISHNGLLRAGTFYLGGDFKQWGDDYSFCATEKHLMVFNGKGSEKQKVYMEHRPESTFNKVRVDGTGYCGVEEDTVFVNSMTAAIIAGIGDALEEEWDTVEGLLKSPEQLLIFRAMEIGASKIPVVGVIIAVCVFIYTCYDFGVALGDTIFGEADRYTKARHLAKKVTHILILMASAKGAEKVKKMLSSEVEATQTLKGCMIEGRFMAEEQIEFAMKEVSEQKLLCEKLVEKEAIGGFSNFSNLSQTERVNLYDMLKIASEEGKVNQFEMETFLTRYADEGITAESYLKWLENARANMLTNTENSYEEICSYLRRLKKEYEKDFVENAKWPKGVKFPTIKAQLVKGLDKHLLKLKRLRTGLPEEYQGTFNNGNIKHNIAYSTSEIKGYDIKGIKAFSQYGNIRNNGINNRDEQNVLIQ